MPKKNFEEQNPKKDEGVKQPPELDTEHERQAGKESEKIDREKPDQLERKENERLDEPPPGP
jgi:hypothetical protein